MGSYILNFTVYTMAMCGLIVFALFVYKKFATGGIASRKSNFLEVEDSLSLAPRKILYVVRAGNEKFLIASDTDKTSLISKLNSSDTQDTFENQLQRTQIKEQILSPRANEVSYVSQIATNSYTETTNKTSTNNFKGIDDLPQILGSGKQTTRKKSEDVIKNMISRVKE